MANTRILGIVLSNRQEESLKVQDLLTKYGCSIKTRLGLHEVTADQCSRSGLILLELIGDLTECDNLENSLKKIEGVEVKRMDFTL